MGIIPREAEELPHNKIRVPCVWSEQSYGISMHFISFDGFVPSPYEGFLKRG